MWRDTLSPREKAWYVAGADNGYTDAYIQVTVALKGDCYRAMPMPTWFKVPESTTMGELAKEMDSFYQDGANISLPMINALHYVHLKLSGATKAELDQYRDSAFKTISRPN